MGDVVPERLNIQVPAVQFLAAVSENTQQTQGGTNNFINYFQHCDKRFNFNGDYSSAPLPIIAADGLDVFEFNSQIIDVWLAVRESGTGGTTEIDIEVSPTPGDPWVSIFTTTPKIQFNAGDYCWVGSVNAPLIGSEYNPAPAYVPPANTVQGVLNGAVTNLITAWSAVRCNLVNSQSGGPDGCFVLLRYRPV